MKNFSKTTKAQDRKIEQLTKKFGMDEKISELEPENEGQYYFKTYAGNAYFNIDRKGQLT